MAVQLRKCHAAPMTTTLKIEHAIVDFEIWKQAFERDPIGREAAGVRRYRVFRPLNDPKYVIIDLDFDGRADAEAFLDELRGVWSRVDQSPGLARAPGPAAQPPRTQIVEQVDTRAY
jgi:hypothetical protein